MPAVHFYWKRGETVDWKEFEYPDCPPGFYLRGRAEKLGAKDLGVFYQGETTEWLMMEFWRDQSHEPTIRALVGMLATELNVPMELYSRITGD